ncbi:MULTISPECIES: hypothetical protein [Streptomyces]|uniref:hypothetical protein n=1 Tax=Streptomyces TaxID=1883 RepID=UPI00117C5DA3|nr:MULTISPECIES: hypothetical protein [Streptomyces]MDX3619857.1 hypothetical protein [Streptomyces europaeiscabiei]MDX3633499.1 hypothetical protein [Streptomyces europaeiscabiei]MDX3651202.1 hypothetical protein [Streptomyces europaeiscabiei]
MSTHSGGFFPYSATCRRQPTKIRNYGWSTGCASADLALAGVAPPNATPLRLRRPALLADHQRPTLRRSGARALIRETGPQPPTPPATPARALDTGDSHPS